MKPTTDPSTPIADRAAPATVPEAGPTDGATPRPFEVERPDGARIVVSPRSSRDTIRDLAGAIGLGPVDELCIDGHPRAAGTRLIDAGIRAGATVGVGVTEPTRLACRGVVEASVTAGPDCRRLGPLGNGRWMIGRSPAAHLRIDDPQLELHHVVVEVRAGRVDVTQLAGHVPVMVDGDPIGGTVTINVPATISLGATEVVIESSAEPAASRSSTGTLTERSNDPWRREVRRGPAVIGPLDVGSLTPPEPAERTALPSAIGLVGAAVAVVGAAVLAVALGQMMFALFALIGAFASFGTWAVGAVDVVRRNRRDRRRALTDRQHFLVGLDRHRAAAREHHCAVHRDIGAALDVAADLHGERSSVWSRRLFTSGADPVDQLRCIVGRGDQRWAVPLDGDLSADIDAAVDHASVLHDVPIPLAVEAGDTVALHGERPLTSALVRSMIAQLATSTGPADWRLVVITNETAAWRWAEWLPHGRDASDSPMIADAHDPAGVSAMLEGAVADPLRPTLLVVDDPGPFSVRTGSVRRYIDAARPATLAIVDGGQTVPALCDRTVAVGAAGRLRIDDSTMTAARNVRLAGITEATARRVARSLASLADPELIADVGRLPSAVGLVDSDPLLVCQPDQRRIAARRLVERWRSAGPDPAPAAPLGKSADGTIDIDLVRDGPHALIAGTTGSGKSELLRSLVVGLAGQVSPEHLTFVLVDYKGGSTFDACADLPHTVGIVTDLDDGLAERALISLDAELHRRERLLRAVGASDLTEYRADPEAVMLPRLAVVIDEFAALAKELPDFLSALVGIAQRGRSLGVHLVLATQRPAGVVTDEIRANTNLRIALRLNDAADAHDVVDDARPTDFTRAFPGRAALRLGPDELIVFQATRCTGQVSARPDRLTAFRAGSGEQTADLADAPSELAVAVATICDAVRLAEIGPPHRPWIDVLPQHLTARDVDATVDEPTHDAIGLIDVPVEQGRRPLRWDRDRGHLALVGAVGAGTTSTLVALITARCRRSAPSDEHWFVIDARGNHVLDGLADLAHCGGVVRPAERERLHRLLMRLDHEVDRVSTDASARPTLSLAIDGLGSLRLALSSIEMAPTLALLERVLADGPSAGVACCWTDDGGTSTAWASAAETWVFHVDDPGTARSFGVVPVAASMPGRLRVASTGLEAQVAHGAAGIAELPDRNTLGGPAAIGVLPPLVRCADVDDGDEVVMPRGVPGEQFVVGIAFDDLACATLDVPVGDHIFIGGGAATGKSAALKLVIAAWSAQHPDGDVMRIDRRTRLTADDVAALSGPTLVAVDDAERVDDPQGLLAALVTAAPPGVLVVAAARLDAVRAAYGHWTRDVACSRCGVILTSPGEVDGDLLGVTLPRRSLIAPRPGLGWVVDARGHRLVQLAHD